MITDTQTGRTYVPTSEAIRLTGRCLATLNNYVRRGVLRKLAVNSRVKLWHRDDLLRLIGEAPQAEHQAECREGATRA